MRPGNFKGRCTKIHIAKCSETARLYDAVQIACAKALDDNDGVAEIRCNVPLEDIEDGKFTTDFLCRKKNGDYMARECVWHKKLLLPRTAKLLDASREYWLRHGVTDWAIVVEKESAEDE